ncbi:MAG: hypothetical protein UU74_C0001G0003 [Candidatus Woesebacteria bacterium GW2011_GWA1_41_7]|uniref:HD domain-containing protein n=3 Tax=Candidatus Woeseibacteriota TaxID=1752722 RepID=A0A0G0Z9N2_9BACT|nr:MAG: hypothetical protein UU74_C0001G0003 [Candidatus Woesebacteria bacterium GW2011_GWA1_41_7]
MTVIIKMMNETLNENTYREIEAYTLSQMAKLENSNHNDEHVVRVKNNALKILTLLGIEGQVDKNLLKAICLLHDFTYTVKKPGMYTYIFEGQIEKRIVQPVLTKFEISDETKKIIISAVSQHAHSFPFRKLNKRHNIYAKVLQDADTLDFFDCLRIKNYMERNNRSIIGKIKNKIGGRMIVYGLQNLGSFLNYPVLAKSFFADSSMKCIS